MSEPNEPTHKIAWELRIIRADVGSPARLYIDGELFPYGTSSGFTTNPRKNEMPSVSFEIVADRVIVEDNIDPKAVGETRVV